jgi:Icc protein
MNPDASRRSFLKFGASAAAGLGVGGAFDCGDDAPRALQAAEAETPSKREFRFVHLTDIHLQPELGAERGFRKCIAHVNELRPRPDFVVTGGDLIMDALEVDHARAVRLWKMYDDCCRDFAMPVYNTIGNHDIVGWSSKAQVSPDHMDYGKRMFADHAGKGHVQQSFDFGGWHFVLLDSIGQSPGKPDYMGLIGEKETAWLRDDLAKTVAAPGASSTSAKPIVFVSHIPFYTAYITMALGPNKLPGEKTMVANAHALRKELLKYDLRLVLQGHVHVRERIDYGKISYIQSGAVSGQWWKGPTIGEHPEGYGVIDVDGDTFTYHYESYGWTAVKA